MKKGIIAVIFIAIFLTGAWLAFSFGSYRGVSLKSLLTANFTSSKKVSGSVLGSYKDATYIIDSQPATLVNGFSETAIASSSAKVTTRYFGNEALGDLNGDGQADAAFLLTQETGGSGTFFYVAAALLTKNGYQGTNAILLGDRIAPQTTEINNGIITVNYADRGPADPFTVQPSIGVSRYFKISSGSLVEIKDAPVAANPKAMVVAPISDAKARVTKKPFGIHVSPGNSPVTPERFTGFHTGVDFEATSSEQDVAVPVYTICSGKLLIKKIANGYGGMAVQSCKLGGQDVTVVYGHLKLSSIKQKVGASLAAGDQLAILGQGYTAETGGERKHLHLGIHKGAAVNTSGYVSTKAALAGWIDIMTLF